MDTSVVLVKGGRIRRRRHSEKFKAGVVAACRQPGVSIAAVALANGLNANLLRRWVANSEAQGAGTVPAAAPVVAADGVVPFVPVTVGEGGGVEHSIRIELQRGAGRVRVHWPLAAAAQCAAWLRDWLK